MGVRDQLSTARLAAEVAPMVRKLVGAARRMAVAASSARAAWTLFGHDKVDEKPTAEVFDTGGLCIYARPLNGADVDVVVQNIAGAAHPIVIASRDMAARKAMAGNLAPGDACVFNPAKTAKVYLRANGTIEVSGAQVLLGQGVFVALQDGVVTGKAQDSYTGLTQGALGNASAVVQAK